MERKAVSLVPSICAAGSGIGLKMAVGPWPYCYHLPFVPGYIHAIAYPIAVMTPGDIYKQYSLYNPVNCVQFLAYNLAFSDSSARLYSVVHRSIVSRNAYREVSEPSAESADLALTASLYLALISW